VKNKNIVPIKFKKINGKVYIPAISLIKYLYNSIHDVKTDREKELLRFLAEEVQAIEERSKSK
jgi:hypothetical protein